MRDAGRRPNGRLSYWLMAVLTAFAFGLPATGAPVPPQGGASTTTVSDSVYLADGAPAAGTLLINWPAFVTAGGSAVASGSTSVKLGPSGSLSVGLMPNAGRLRRACTTRSCIRWGRGR